MIRDETVSIRVAVVQASLLGIDQIGIGTPPQLFLDHALVLQVLLSALRIKMLQVLFLGTRVHRPAAVPVVAHPLPGFEKLLIQQWIVSLLPIDDDDVHAGHANLRRVEESILDELLLHRHLEAPLLLLQLRNYVFHVLLDLVLLLDFEPVGRIWSQFRVELVLLLAYENFQVVELGRLQVALHLGNLVRQLTLIGFDLDEAIQIQWLRGHAQTVWTLHRADAEHLPVLIWRLIRREVLLFVIVLLCSLLLHLALINKAATRTNRPLIHAIHILLVHRSEVLVHLLRLVGAILLALVIHDEYLPARVFFDKLLHRHLNKHVVVYLVRAAAFQLPRDSTVDGCLVRLSVRRGAHFWIVCAIIFD